MVGIKLAAAHAEITVVFAFSLIFLILIIELQHCLHFHVKNYYTFEIPTYNCLFIADQKNAESN